MYDFNKKIKNTNFIHNNTPDPSTTYSSIREQLDDTLLNRMRSNDLIEKMRENDPLVKLFGSKYKKR